MKQNVQKKTHLKYSNPTELEPLSETSPEQDAVGRDDCVNAAALTELSCTTVGWKVERAC